MSIIIKNNINNVVISDKVSGNSQENYRLYILRIGIHILTIVITLSWILYFFLIKRFYFLEIHLSFQFEG